MSERARSGILKIFEMEAGSLAVKMGSVEARDICEKTGKFARMDMACVLTITAWTSLVGLSIE